MNGSDKAVRRHPDMGPGTVPRKIIGDSDQAIPA